MPYRRRGFSGRRFMRPIINSIKNVTTGSDPPSTTLASFIIAKAVTAPSPTVTSDVSHGCVIKAIYLTINGCGLQSTGALQIFSLYLIKNPGNNLTVPQPGSVGGSNEKKFVFRQWQFMTMRNQDGNLPFHWEGWIRIPKRYQRMGTDDILQLIYATSASVGHFTAEAIYKWYR